MDRRPLLSLLLALLAAAGCGGSILPDKTREPKGSVNDYKRELERRLLAKYNNLPSFANRIAKVELILNTAPEKSSDGRLVRVEYDQIITDIWGERVPELEKEYFIVTFGDGTPHAVSSDPTLTIGMRTEGDYSERTPIETGRLGALRAQEGKTSAAPLLPPLLPAGEDAAPPADRVPVIPPAEEDWTPSVHPAAPSARGGIEAEAQSMAAPAGASRPPRAEVRLPAGPEL